MSNLCERRFDLVRALCSIVCSCTEDSCDKKQDRNLRSVFGAYKKQVAKLQRVFALNIALNLRAESLKVLNLFRRMKRFVRKAKEPTNGPNEVHLLN